MGLTRPRAHQVQDLDYKQTARAVTTSNITLSGGAPATVDGVSLALRDRILVTGQSTGSENGIYYVTTVGAGSNGTWARSLDADATGEVSAGMIIMVTEGTTYADTQWKLTTDDPITIGSTSLTFVRNGNNAYGTVAVSGEDSIVADTIGDTLTIVAGTNLALTTNASTDTLTITPSLTPSLTSLTATGNITGNNLLTGNVTVDDSGITATGNIQADMLINREQRFTTSNMMKFNQLYTGAASGSYFTNGEYQKVVTITPSGDAQNYQVVGRMTAQNAAETHTVYFNAALRSNTLPDLDWSILYTEEYNGSRYLDPQLWTKETTTAGFIFAFKTLATIYGTVTVDIDVIPRASSQLDNVSVNTTQNSEQASVDAGFTARDMTLVQRLQNTNMTVPGNLTVDGTITGNVTGDLTGDVTGNLTGEVTGNVSGSAATATSATTAGTVTSNAQPNITSVGTLTSVTVSGNATANNISVTNFVGSNLIPSANATYNLGSATNQWNEVHIAGSTLYLGDLQLKDSGGNTFTVFGSDGTTPAEVTGNIAGANVTGAVANATYADSSGTAATVTTAAQPNITSVGTLTSVSVTGNVSAGNVDGSRANFTNLVGTLETASQTNITSVGTLGSLTVTGNINAGNVVATIVGDVTGNVSGTAATVTTAAQPNITSTGTLTSVTVSGNAIVGGNLTVSGNTVYTNVSTFSVQDPIIDLGRGANGAVLVSDDGKDRGTQLYYYSGSEKSAFVGYDNSEDKIILAKDVSISDEVVTVSTYGNAIVGGLEATTVEASGNIDAGNVNVTSISGTLITAAQTNITSVGTLGSLNVTGNVSAGNVSGTNITGTLETASQTNITSVGTLGSLTVTGNIGAGNVNATIVGDVTGDVTGNVSGTAATVTTAAQPNITSVGTLTSVTTSGNISTDGNININDRQGLYLHDSDSSHYVALVPPATVTGNVTFVLPGDSGTADYVLATNGAGTLSWVEQSGGGSSGASSFPNSTVTPLPSSEGDFDLSYNYAQTTQETPFETGGTDAFGVSLGEVYSMMDPAGDIPDATDLGVLT